MAGDLVKTLLCCGVPLSASSQPCVQLYDEVNIPADIMAGYMMIDKGDVKEVLRYKCLVGLAGREFVQECYEEEQKVRRREVGLLLSLRVVSFAPKMPRPEWWLLIGWNGQGFETAFTCLPQIWGTRGLQLVTRNEKGQVITDGAADPYFTCDRVSDSCLELIIKIDKFHTNQAGHLLRKRRKHYSYCMLSGLSTLHYVAMSTYLKRNNYCRTLKGFRLPNKQERHHLSSKVYQQGYITRNEH